MGVSLMPSKSVETKPPFQATNHREYFSYPRQVQRFDRELDGHLSAIFTLLLKLAVKAIDGLGSEAHQALLALVRA